MRGVPRVEPLLEPVRSAADDAPDPYGTCDDAERQGLSHAPARRRAGRTIRYSVRDEIKSTVVDEFVSG